MTLLALSAVIALNASEKDLYLQSLVPTSGSGAEAVLDGKADTGWTPEGTPAGEGVLLRFEDGVKPTEVEVTGCAGDTTTWGAYVDGRRYSTPLTIDKTGKAKFKPYFVPFRSLFLKVESKGTKGCLAEVTFAGLEGAVKPPRQVHGKVTVSSVLSPEDAYHPGYLFDGRTDFGWVEGSKGTGEGEWLQLSLDKPLTVTAFELWNGYQRSTDHFQKNCRAKKVTLSVDGADGVPLDVKDVEGPQKLVLPKPVKGTTFKLVIDEVVKGNKYTDMVITELRLFDDVGPLHVATDDLKERTAALKKDLAGQPLGDLLDKSLSSVCDGANLSVKLRSNHTFAIYETQERGSVSVTEVVDGAWIVKSPTSIELFGRRQRISVDDRPYGSGEQETIRITGGPVGVSRVSDLGKDGYLKLLQKWTKGPAKRHVVCAPVSKLDTLASAVVLDGTAITGLVAP